MDTWTQRQALTAHSLRDRRLVWFGTRGTDAEPLAHIGDLAAVFCLIAPFSTKNTSARVTCLEQRTGRRVDLNRYSVDADRSLEAQVLRRELGEALSVPSALVPYRPLALLAPNFFPDPDRVRYLGMFHLHQACFEHKPWLEQTLAGAGVPTIPWRYLRRHQRDVALDALTRGPIVLRTNIGDGGAGLTLVHDHHELGTLPVGDEGFCGMAPYLGGAAPLNLNAVVYADGSVEVFPLSFQLIGLPGCTSRPFGFCGNDFGAARQLPPDVLEDAATIGRAVGARLARLGYLGIFGLDLLWHQGQLMVTEVNPRFQCSTPLSAQLSRQAGLPDAFLEHVAAHLGMAAPTGLPPFAERMAGLADRSQVIAYNRSDHTLWTEPIGDPGQPHVVGMPEDRVGVDPEAMLLKAVFDHTVTTDGFRLLEPARRAVERLVRAIVD